MPSEMLSKTEYEERLAKLEAAEARLAAAPELTQKESAAGTAGFAIQGEPYTIGGKPFKPITMGSLNRLQLIGAPILDDEADADPTLQQITEILYVLSEGISAVRPIIALERRMAAALGMERLAKVKPEYFERYLEHIDRVITDAWTEFSIAAAEFGDSMGPFSMAEAEETIGLMFRDGMDGFGLLPETPEKKTEDLTGNG